MDLPFLLAGPIVRRVDSSGATFWLTFSEQVTVTAKVWQGDQISTGPGQVQSGAFTVAESTPTSSASFGSKLHIVTVTATPGQGSLLVPGSIHAYDIVVEGSGGLKALGLLEDSSASGNGIHADAPERLALGYLPDRLPTFVTAAAGLGDLRFAHTSCRKPHGSGPDALAWLDDVIEDERLDPVNRPQHLFLTGDQIYADDVAACLLPMLQGLARDLLGFDETVPIRPPQGSPDVAAFAHSKDLPAMRRARLVIEGAKFSTTDGSSHLLGFGEFAAMYLAAWSPRVWRPLATRAALFTTVPEADRERLLLTDHEGYYRREERASSDPDAVSKWSDADAERTRDKDGGTDEQRAAVAQFIASVPRVARVLANTSTMMIFDDHEITDDWYLSAPWRTRVLVAPLGRAIIRNGLMAYTVFQATGNDPTQWRDPTTAPTDHQAGTAYPMGSVVRHSGETYWAPTAIPANGKAPGTDGAAWRLIAGPSVIASIRTLIADGAAPVVAHTDELDRLLGLNSPTATPKVSYHYTLDGVRHRVVVLDTRTRRTYGSATRHAPPKLLGDSMKAMLPEGPLADGRELLILVSPAPLLIPRIFDSLMQPAMASVSDVKAHIMGTERYDPGNPTPPSLVGSEQADLEGWGANEPAFNEFVRHLGTYTRVVAIGGDVHFASSMACDVWTKAGGAAAASRILQCTASAAKNQWPATIRAIIRGQRSAQRLLKGETVERLGWDGDHGIVLPPAAHIRPGRRARLMRKPTSVPAGGWPTGTTLDAAKPVDVFLRIAVLRDERASLGIGAPVVPGLTTWNSGSPDQVLASYAAVAAAHQQLLASPSDPVRLLVFGNNLGIVSFTASSAGEYQATHAIYSPVGDGTTGADFTHHSLDLARSAAGAPPALVAGG